MKSLFILSLLVIGACTTIVPFPVLDPNAPLVVQQPVSVGYSDYTLTGRCINMTASVPDLRDCDFDDTMSSVLQTGLWVYYENKDFNLIPGRVYFGFGINVSFSLPVHLRKIVSSVALIQTHINLRDSAIVLFEGHHLTLKSHLWQTDVESFGPLGGKLHSVLVIGESPWTLFSYESFIGPKVCIYPNVDYPALPQPILSFRLGIYSNATMLGSSQLVIKSAKKGCSAMKRAGTEKFKLDGHNKKGGWGGIL